MRDKSAEPYEMEKSREGSGSKDIQIKERRGIPGGKTPNRENYHRY